MAASRAPESQKTYSSGVNWTHVLTPTLLNEFRFGVAHYRNKAQQTDYGQNDSTALGIPGINISDFNSGLVGIGISSFTSPLVGYSASLPWDRAPRPISTWLTMSYSRRTTTLPSRLASICGASVTICCRPRPTVPGGFTSLAPAKRTAPATASLATAVSVRRPPRKSHYLVGQLPGKLPSRQPPGRQHRPRLQRHVPDLPAMVLLPIYIGQMAGQ